MTPQDPSNPNQYVRENKETLVDIIKHGTDDFVRALAIAALVEYGEEPEIKQIRHEFNRIAEQEELE